MTLRSAQVLAWTRSARCRLLSGRIAATPLAEAYRHFDQRAGSWISYSWQEIGQLIERWGRAIDEERSAYGDRVAILVPNGIEHVAMDQAALSRGLVPVPLHGIDNPESMVYIIEDSGARMLLVDTLDRWRKLASADDRLAGLKRVVCVSADAAAEPGDGRVMALAGWLDGGRALPVGKARAAHVKPTDLAAIVYTSGTTGRPKGVMLSHANVIANVKAAHERLPAIANDVFLSFLPLSHTFERTAGYYYPIAVGAAVVYARSTQHLPEDLKTVRPTILISVPRIYERFYAKIMEHRATASWPERAALDLALTIGGRRFDARQGRGHGPAFLDDLVWPVLKRAVADKVLAQLGGRLRVAVSGGAPIAEPIIRLFLSLGLDVLQGYRHYRDLAGGCGQHAGRQRPTHCGPAARRDRGQDRRQRGAAGARPERHGRLLAQAGGDAQGDRGRRLAAHRRPGPHRGRADHDHGPNQRHHRHLNRREDRTRRPGDGHRVRSAV
jgi:long-chain acyl-CoA synthetase